MGKIKELLSSGIGLAMEAASSNTPTPTRPSTQRPSASRVYDASRYETNNQQKSRNAPERSISPNSGISYAEEEQGHYHNESNRVHDERSDYGNQPVWFPQDTPQRGLPRPVIIPQRRPQNKSRGWYRAYAPALMNCGIDQDTFVSFIESFNKASQASPYLDAVNIAAFGVGFAPGITPMIISTALPIAVKYAKQSQTNHKTKTYLDKMNEELFVPNGLYAMVMTYKPEQQSLMLNVNKDSSQTQSPYASYENSNNSQDGGYELPEACPLVFFDHGSLPSDQQAKGFEKFTDFVADYSDRRSRARFAQENPGSALNGPMPTFKSRWGDPTTSSSNKDGRQSRKDLKRAEKEAEKEEEKAYKERRKRRSSRSDGRNDRGGLIHGLISNVAESSGHSGLVGDRRPGLVGGVRSMVVGQTQSGATGKKDQGLIKSLKGIGTNTDTLYLMIVNNPTDDSNSQGLSPTRSLARNRTARLSVAPQLDFSYVDSQSVNRRWDRYHEDTYPRGDGDYVSQQQPHQYRPEEYVGQQQPHQYYPEEYIGNDMPPMYSVAATGQRRSQRDWERDEKDYCVPGF
ncbi:hypothetical protein B7463_g12323, partial [Scytalidium lignicola]